MQWTILLYWTACCFVSFHGANQNLYPSGNILGTIRALSHIGHYAPLQKNLGGIAASHLGESVHSSQVRCPEPCFSANMTDNMVASPVSRTKNDTFLYTSDPVLRGEANSNSTSNSLLVLRLTDTCLVCLIGINCARHSSDVESAVSMTPGLQCSSAASCLSESFRHFCIGSQLISIRLQWQLLLSKTFRSRELVPPTVDRVFQCKTILRGALQAAYVHL